MNVFQCNVHVTICVIRPIRSRFSLSIKTFSIQFNSFEAFSFVYICYFEEQIGVRVTPNFSPVGSEYVDYSVANKDALRAG